MEGKQASFPLLTVLTGVLAILKLAGVAPFSGWSWWWVLAPCWGPLAAIAGIGLIIVIVKIVAGSVDARRRR